MQNNTKYIFKKTFLKIICLIVWETDKKRVAIALEWLCYVQPITVRGDYIIRRTICDSTYAISTLQDTKHRSLWTDECAVASGSIRPYLYIEWSKKPEQFDICCSHALSAGISRGVRRTAMWCSVTGRKMTDISRQHGALILKGTNTIGQITVFWDASPFSLLYEGWNFNSGNYLFTTDTK